MKDVVETLLKARALIETAMNMAEVQQGIRRQQLIQAFGAVESVRCQIQHDSIREVHRAAFARMAKRKKKRLK